MSFVVITFAGAMTSFLAATNEILQNDLKRVIAYSTYSQLSYMTFACDIFSYSVSVFQLMNHRLRECHFPVNVRGFRGNYTRSHKAF
uniref:NADH:quinone oxidoreductase/Mrp antiporter transmembrane domain-containing protein n=2 Tax=Aegilops tauschii subsp. strangulata TaxID=200361 RepID=A0A453SSH8_AEGTS